MSAIGPLTLEQRTCRLTIDSLAPSIIQAPKSGAVNYALRTQRLRMERHHPNPWGSLPCRFHTGQTRQNCRCCRSMPYLTTVQAIALRTACLAALAACANSPSAQEQISSRDFRSQAYCFIRANQAGSSDYDVAGTCERAERVAKARSQTTHIDAELDRFCDEEATYGGAGGPFSWRAYMRCVDTSI